MCDFVIEMDESAFYAHSLTIEMLNFHLKCFSYVVCLVQWHSSVEYDIHFGKDTGTDLRKYR